MSTESSAAADPRLLGPADVRSLATRYGVRPAKHRGQNFVIDANTLRRVVGEARLADDDVVLEIGSGLGSLTLALLERGHRVTAVEVDPVLAAALPAIVSEFAPRLADRLQVVNADALRLPTLPGPTPTALVSNLPYNIAVPVVLNLLATLPSLDRVLVMVQLEVAERLAADPGSKTYGAPSVKAAWYADVRRAGLVGRTVFWPAPNVDSGLVAMRRHTPPQTAATREQVFAVVDAAFGQRRKMLRSALATLASSNAAAEAALVAAGVAPTRRGEELGVVEFARVAECLFASP